MNKHERTCKDACLTHSDPSVREAASKVWPAPRKRTERERASVKAKGEKRQGRKERSAEVYEEVRHRAGGVCELCLCPPRAWDGLVMHHVISGVGKRKAEEAVENVIALHDRSCHKNIHADPTWASFHIRSWCERHGYLATWVRFQQRIAKVAECRATRAKENA